jgi:hypothetical protein
MRLILLAAFFIIPSSIYAVNIDGAVRTDKETYCELYSFSKTNRAIDFESFNKGGHKKYAQYHYCLYQNKNYPFLVKVVKSEEVKNIAVFYSGGQNDI